jgi:hypothetical protein
VIDKSFSFSCQYLSVCHPGRSTRSVRRAGTQELRAATFASGSQAFATPKRGYCHA